MHHVFKLKSNRLNNRDFNIDQNIRDYDFFSHNQAALGGGGGGACYPHGNSPRQRCDNTFVTRQ